MFSVGPTLPPRPNYGFVGGGKALPIPNARVLGFRRTVRLAAGAFAIRSNLKEREYFKAVPTIIERMFQLAAASAAMCVCRWLVLTCIRECPNKINDRVSFFGAIHLAYHWQAQEPVRRGSSLIAAESFGEALE